MWSMGKITMKRGSNFNSCMIAASFNPVIDIAHQLFDEIRIRIGDGSDENAQKTDSGTNMTLYLIYIVVVTLNNPKHDIPSKFVIHLKFHAFNWESHKYDWWKNLEIRTPDIAKSGFTSAWLPPASQSFSPEGYLPQNLYSLDSAYGSEKLLKSLLHKMKQHKVRAMADIVINHRVGTSKGHGGLYNRYDGIPLSWDEHAVTSCTGGLVS
ncbi:hypothetical protein Cgig2_031949 [Carnegiea gigantea]|uniref:1,4-alpha-D-glucan glucanohydrolase n=1 Tax=Carnegiea gigantea TaxID=171969 RepID=A0A9Q1QCQ1_9CARY|nr:hypothetical protein Cgig2_031949 [Carnegiea gigantea]